MTDEEWAEFDTPEGFWKKMVEVAHLPECKNDRRHEATRWADAELKRLREEYEAIYTDRNLFIECVHEKAVEIDRLREENKRLREAVEWACENAPAGENVYVSAIRRRAKEG